MIFYNSIKTNMLFKKTTIFYRERAWRDNTKKKNFQ